MYTKLLADRADDSGLLSTRAEILLRLGRFRQADFDIAALRAKADSEPWYVYLEGLSAHIQGDRESLASAVRSALSNLPAEEQSSASTLSNRALFAVACGEVGDARRMYNRLLTDGRLDQLRYCSVPELSDLASAIPERGEISEIRQQIISVLWSQGCGIEPKVDKQLEALKTMKRTAYSFPMYCQLSGIAGLDEDRRLASKIFAAENLHPNKSSERTIIFWTMGRPDRLYGHSNFKKDEGSSYDLKFCDTTELTLSTNLRIFVQELGVRRLLFLEPTLLQKFQDEARANGLLVACTLVEYQSSELDRFLDDE